MPLSWDLILRFTLGGGQRRFTRFVALASLLGMMLGVAALITVLSVMNGFGGELYQRLLTVTPDMVLEPATPSEAALDELLTAATEQSAVVAATPVHQGTALLRHQGFRELDRLRAAFAGKGDPSEPLIHGAMILFAGALLLTPGFFTDTVGFLLLFPPVRTYLFTQIRARIVVHDRTGPPRGPDIIEGDFEPVETEPDRPSGWTRH